MLHWETVNNSTKELLKNLCATRELAQVRLVGGTALSLQIGHRISVDLDLFTNENFDVSFIEQVLMMDFGFIPSIINEFTLIGEINNVKIDVIYHPFPWLNNEIVEDDVRLASLDDIVAMKLHAIVNSGKRPKDFVDIAYLSQQFSYNQMKSLLLKKYPQYDPIMADRAINFFGDIDPESVATIRMIERNFDFRKIQDRLIKMTDKPSSIFLHSPCYQNKKRSLEPYHKLQI